MKTFDDLAFHQKPWTVGDEEDIHALMDFDNGYGVSVIRGPYSYGGDRGLYEMAIIKDDSITYDTHITSDVLGHLTESDVTEYMKQVQEL